MEYGICPVCKKRKPLSIHHVFRRKVFEGTSLTRTILICERCHNFGTNCLEALITERENEILRLRPELYIDALNDYINGVRPKRPTYRRRK